MDIEKLREKLIKHGQEHLLQFWNELSEADRQRLYTELEAMDYEKILKYFNVCMTPVAKVDDRLEPLPGNVCGSVATTEAETLQKYETEGLKQIGDGKVCVLLLAGGQGTRLGVSYPKGMYNVGLPSKKTLYQLQAERITKVQSMAQISTGKSGTVMWYIMTSEHTQDATLEFFKSHNYFGLDAANIVFFEQNTLPAMTMDGKVILETKSRLSRAPDGNGGLYKALEDNHILEDMNQRGIEFIHVYCVDNILVRMADPVFIGFCIAKGVNCGAKVVEKIDPNEPVGVVCLLDGKYSVVEYSEISPSTAEKRQTDGKLAFNAGGIANHFFTLDFLKLIVSEKEDQLIHHVARKKIPFCNSKGELVKPTQPNGIKMEKFVFDVFQFSDAFAVWEVKREDEFSPLKNADGAAVDTPTTSRLALLNLHYRWILEAGGKFINEDGSLLARDVKPVECEISSLLSYAGEGLDKLVNGKLFKPPLILEVSDDAKCRRMTELPTMD